MAGPFTKKTERAVAQAVRKAMKRCDLSASGPSTEQAIDPRSISASALDTFILSALKELGLDAPFILLPEERLYHLKRVMQSIQRPVKNTTPTTLGVLSYPLRVFAENASDSKRSIDNLLNTVKEQLSELAVYRLLERARAEGRDPKRFELRVTMVFA